MDLDQQADELYESWINGNLGHVVGVLTRGTSRPDVIMCVALAVKVSALMSERERSVLLRILKDKM
jgi:hypothetical protein